MSAEIEQVTLAVAAINKVEMGLNALRMSYEGVVFEVTTTKGLDDAKAARSEIREPRYEVERIRKAAKAPLLAIGKRLDSEAARITAELEKIEGPIHAQIQAEEARKEAEKQARIDAEVKRVQAIQERIADLRGNQTLSPTSGAGVIMDAINALDSVQIGDSFAEFQPQATDVKATALLKLWKLHVAAVEHQEEQERIKRERADLAKLRAEQEERDRVAKAERDYEESIAQAKRNAEREEQVAAAKAHAEELRLEREQIARDREEARLFQQAEGDRLAAERAKLAAEQEALRIANLPKPKPRKAPTLAEMADVIAQHYSVAPKQAMQWLMKQIRETA